LRAEYGPLRLDALGAAVIERPKKPELSPHFFELWKKYNASFEEYQAFTSLRLATYNAAKNYADTHVRRVIDM
jgi:hypothetical protein